MDAMRQSTPSPFKSVDDLFSAKRSLFPLASLIAVSIIVYCNSLANGFVLDDLFQVVKNPWIKDLRYIPQIVSSNVWGFLGLKGLNYYRPFVFLIYTFIYQLFGLAPWAFHGVNILFHAGVSVLVFLITSRLLTLGQPENGRTSLMLPLLAGLLFATHPIHTEAVTWVAGLPDLSFTFFSLLAWYLLMRADCSDESSLGWRVLSPVSFALALFCKETALILPLIFLIYDYLFQRDKLRPLSAVKRYLPYFLVIAGYFLVRYYALGGFAPHRLHSELTTYQYLLNIAPLFAQYLTKLFLPVDLKEFYVLHPVTSFFDIRMITSLIIAAAFVAIGWVARDKNKLISLSIVLITVPLLPVLYIPLVGLNTFTERYLYLPSLGFVALFVSGVSLAGMRSTMIRKISPVILTVVVCLYSAGTITRNFDWKDDGTILADTIEKSPDIASHHKALGTMLFTKGLTDEAITNFQLAAAFDHTDAELYNSLGVAFEKRGWIDDAVDSFNSAVLLKPDSAQFHNSLGAVLAMKGKIDEAIPHYRNAIALQPSYADAHNNLGNAYMAKGWTDLAIREYQLVLAEAPTFPDAYNNLGVAYAKKGLISEAIKQFEAALRLKPDDANIRSNLTQAQEGISR